MESQAIAVSGRGAQHPGQGGEPTPGKVFKLAKSSPNDRRLWVFAPRGRGYRSSRGFQRSWQAAIDV